VPHVDLAAWSNNLASMERFAREHKLEGIVAKRSDSRYEPGKRSGCWVKLRFTREKMALCTWLKPIAVAEIEFAEWTPDERLRHAAFVGQRSDKDPKKVFRDT
jgi:bifunctional non-homologous end joining protein LigD